MDGSFAYAQDCAVLDFEAVADTIGRLNAAGLIGCGSLAVLNLEPIRRAMGPRWGAKQPVVFEHAERTLRRDLGPDAVIAAAGDVDVVVAQPGVVPVVALSRTLQALRDVLRFFIGEVPPDQLLLSQVDTAEGGALVCRRVDSRTLDARAGAPAGPGARVPNPAPAASLPTHTDFVSVDGMRIRVTCGRDDLFLLKSGAQVGSRLRPCLTDISGPNRLSVRVNSLEGRDAEAVDHAVLRQAAAHFPLDAGPPMVVAPVAFSTLSTQRGRRDVLDELLALSGRLNSRPILEIRDLRGVPSSRLAEIVSLMRPATAAILGEVEADKASIAGLAGCGLGGLVIRTLADWPQDRKLFLHFRGLAELARCVAPVCIGRGVSVMRLPGMLEAGFTHAFVCPADAPVAMGPTGSCVIRA